MILPKFTAAESVYRSVRSYRSGGYSGTRADRVVPALPFCDNCDYILDRCAENGFRPRAVCWACATGRCYSGVEDPTPDDPYTPDPWRRW